MLLSFFPYACALAIGALGALIAVWITLPLPWMLGPMIACLLAVAFGAPVKAPLKIRPVMVLVLGVMLGSGFTPDLINQLGDWLVSLAFLGAYIACAGALVYPYFRKVAGYDPITSYFSAMPGGLNEMMIVGASYGGDERKIALVHASRILIAVLTIPIGFRLIEGVDTSANADLGISLTEIAPIDLGILAACAALGWPLGKVLRLPAGALLGPMILSAAAHLTGLTASQPPTEILNLAQWVLGTAIGCRFVGVPRAEIARIMAAAIGATCILLGITAFFAFILTQMTELDPRLVILAYAPGGLAEMSLVALALGADVAYVATHHVIRISSVVIAAAGVFRLLKIGRRDTEI